MYIRISQRNETGHTYPDVTVKTRALSTCHDNNAGSAPIPTSAENKRILNEKEKLINP